MRLMVDRRLLANFDYATLLTMILIASLGVMTIYSASYDPSALESSWGHASRQAVWATLGLVAALTMVSFDYRRLERYSVLIYVVCLCLLAAVPLIGSVSGGSRRWIGLGGFSLQPSETMKLALILFLARYFHHRARPAGLRLRDLVIPAVAAAIPAALILEQPDLGTAGVTLFVFASMVILAGPSLGTLALLLVGAASSLPILIANLKPYQIRRLTTFWNPELDPRGAGYHVIQSKIAIGSGGLLGRGYLEGTQNQLNFLPAQHTDFIFSVFSEEWGFVGAIVLLALYLALLLRGLMIVYRAKERFGALLAFGVLANVFWQAAINTGMASGSLPVVGITLPLFSYGGSSLVTMMAGLGLVINVSSRRFSRERLPHL
jgi:rod shape determining protein RodA